MIFDPIKYPYLTTETAQKIAEAFYAYVIPLQDLDKLEQIRASCRDTESGIQSIQNKLGDSLWDSMGETRDACRYLADCIDRLGSPEDNASEWADLLFIAKYAEDVSSTELTQMEEWYLKPVSDATAQFVVSPILIKFQDSEEGDIFLEDQARLKRFADRKYRVFTSEENVYLGCPVEEIDEINWLEVALLYFGNAESSGMYKPMEEEVQGFAS